MECTFTKWEKEIILQVLDVFEAVEKLKESELERFRENEDMSDAIAVKAYWEIREAFDDLIKKLEKPDIRLAQQVEAAITIFKTGEAVVKKESEDLGYFIALLADMADDKSVVITISTERLALKFFPHRRIDFIELDVKGKVPVGPYTYHIDNESEVDRDELHQKYRGKMFTWVLQAFLKGQAGIKIEKPD